MGETEEISVVSLRPERAGGSLSVTEVPKVTTEEDRVEAGPTKASDIRLFRKTDYIFPGVRFSDILMDLRYDLLLLKAFFKYKSQFFK